MRTIHKQKIEITDFQTIELPEKSRILHLGKQGKNGVGGDNVCIWYECDTDMPKKKANIHCFGTGHEMPDNDNLQYIDTVLIFDDSLVFHFYLEQV